MQIKVTRNPSSIANVEDAESFPNIASGTVIEGVVAVHLCRGSPHLRSVEIEAAPDGNVYQGVNTFLLIPANTFVIQESTGWQQYARGIEEKARAA